MRRVAEVLLARSGVAEAWGRATKARAVVLAYHNVVPRGESAVGDRSLHLDQADFAAQLDRLTDTHEVVALQDLPERLPASTGRPLAVVTFDDAYRGALTAGREELEARGLPWTVFVCPAHLGAEGFWWDLLADDDGLPARVRDVALGSLRGDQELVLADAVADGRRPGPLPDHARPVEPEELAAVAEATASLSLGSHTWSHPNLTALDVGEVDAELARARRWLDERGAAAAGWLAYPYGLSSPAVVDVARRHADHGLRVEGGAAHVRGEWAGGAFALPRVNVPRGMSVDGLALRLWGLIGG